jgi:hypothetical protein
MPPAEWETENFASRWVHLLQCLRPGGSVLCTNGLTFGLSPLFLRTESRTSCHCLRSVAVSSTGQNISFLLTENFSLHHLVQTGSGAHPTSLGVKRPGHVADYSPPSSAEVKECMELYLHSRNTPSWRGARLKLALCNVFHPSELSMTSRCSDWLVLILFNDTSKYKG